MFIYGIRWSNMVPVYKQMVCSTTEAVLWSHTETLNAVRNICRIFLLMVSILEKQHHRIQLFSINSSLLTDNDKYFILFIWLLWRRGNTSTTLLLFSTSPAGRHIQTFHSRGFTGPFKAHFSMFMLCFIPFQTKSNEGFSNFKGLLSGFLCLGLMLVSQTNLEAIERNLINLFDCFWNIPECIDKSDDVGHKTSNPLWMESMKCNPERLLWAGKQTNWHVWTNWI